jgi:hypothetical protein
MLSDFIFVHHCAPTVTSPLLRNNMFQEWTSGLIVAVERDRLTWMALLVFFALARALFLKVWSTDHRWSAAIRQVVRGGFGQKKHCKSCLDTQRMENTAIHVCAKTVFVR